MSICEGYNREAQIINSQVADELLNIKGIRASFVAGKNMNGKTVVSARSLGALNVQLIMEKLGGGGHLTTAGAQVDCSPEEVLEKVQKLVEEYNAIGHVPYKEKDKLYEEYHAVLDKLYKELNISVAKKRLNKFKDNLKQVAERGEGALDNERARLMRQYESLKQEIQTYENNLGFLTASSKKGNSLIEEMNRKIQKLKDDMQLVKEKIKAIDAENQ